MSKKYKIEKFPLVLEEIHCILIQPTMTAITHIIPDRYYDLPLISSHPYASEIFETLCVSKELDAHVRIFDSNTEESLILLHYLEPVVGVQHVRGTILFLTSTLEGEKKAVIVSTSFPYTPEYEYSECLAQSLASDTTTWSLAPEGTVLRLFTAPFSGKQYLATHRRINGRNSKWGGRNFGELFDSLTTNIDLDREFDYPQVFLLSTMDNVGVSLDIEPTLYHIGEGCEQVLPALFDLGLPKPTHNIFTQEHLASFKEVIDSLSPRTYSGVLVYNGATGLYTKILSHGYAQLDGLRGNSPSLRLRWIELNHEGRAHELEQAFPNFSEDFALYRTLVSEIPKTLFELVMARKNAERFLEYEKYQHEACVLVHSLTKNANVSFVTKNDPSFIYEKCVQATSLLTPQTINKFMKAF